MVRFWTCSCHHGPACGWSFGDKWWAVVPHLAKNSPAKALPIRVGFPQASPLITLAILVITNGESTSVVIAVLACHAICLIGIGQLRYAEVVIISGAGTSRLTSATRIDWRDGRCRASSPSAARPGPRLAARLRPAIKLRIWMRMG